MRPATDSLSSSTSLPSDLSESRGHGEHQAPRAQRHSGKGRRRRGAAEQRRADQQRWGELRSEFGGCAEAEEEGVALSASYDNALRPGARRQQRRASRRALAAAEVAAAQEEIAQLFAWEYSRGSTSQERTRSSSSSSLIGIAAAAEEDLEFALAISLSLSDASPSPAALRAAQRALAGDMTYENLVSLEAVPRAVPAAVVESLPVQPFLPEPHDHDSGEVCAICLGEFVEGDSLMLLPCSHQYHQACSKEWLLLYSNSCPVCKHNVA